MKVVDIFENTEEPDIDTFLAMSDDEKKQWIDDNLTGKFRIPNSTFYTMFWELQKLPTPSLSNDVMEFMVELNTSTICYTIYDRGKKLPPEYLIYKVLDRSPIVVGNFVNEIRHHPELVQKYIMYAVRRDISCLNWMSKNLPTYMIHPILTDTDIIKNNTKDKYDTVVKKLFPRSSLLVDRWVGYGDHVRQRKPRGTK